MFIEEGLVPLHCATFQWTTPLYVAVWFRGLQAIELLFQMGADLDGCYGRVLETAVFFKQKEIVKILLRYGANPQPFLSISTQFGYAKTPLSKARSEIEGLLVATKEKGEYYVASTEPRTTFAANAPDLVVSEAVEENTTSIG